MIEWPASTIAHSTIIERSRTIAYDFSRQALYAPQRRPVFVAADRVDAFQPHKRGLSLANAWWLSNAAHLAYFDGSQIEGVLHENRRSLGLSLVEFFDNGGTRGYLAGGDGFAILAFRGTQPGEVRDLATDLKFHQRELSAVGGSVAVHSGFLEALEHVWEPVQSCLEALSETSTPVWFTGHSLGAALATLAAVRHQPAALYTFGSPRVGQEGLRNVLVGFEVERFVNCTDIVTSVPPPLLRYRHAGTQRFFTHLGHLHNDPDTCLVARARRAGTFAYQKTFPLVHRGMVKLRRLADHAIVNYTESILRAMEATDGRAGNELAV